MSTDDADCLRIIEASGDEREIGRQLGRFGREFVHTRLRGSPAWSTVTALANGDRIRAMAGKVETHFPAIHAELVGLAEGLDLPFAEVFAWNCRGDIKPIAPDGCTTVQIPGRRILIAHNEDGHPAFRGHCGLLRARPDHGIEWTAFVYPGSLPGHTFAATARGLTVTVNNIRSSAIGEGLPRMALTRAILNCRSLDEALTLLQGAERAGSFHVTVAQVGDDRLFSVEFTAARCSICRIEAPAIHANHLVHADMTDESQIVTASSEARQRRGEALVACGLAASDPLAVLRDRCADLSIWRDRPDDPDEENTVATAFFSVEETRLEWSIHGASRELARFHGLERASSIE